MLKGGKFLVFILFSLSILLGSAFLCFAAEEGANVQVEVIEEGGYVPLPPPVVTDTTPPVITNIQVINITENSATITWETDEPASSIIYYGETAAYGDQVTDSNLITVHSLNITGLDPETLYHFNIQATDSSNNSSQSGDYTFTTASIAGLFIPGPPILTAISPSVLNIVIDTNDNTDDVLYLINETTTGKYLQSDRTLGDDQVWQSYNSWGGIWGKNITGLAENTPYTFRVKAKNNSGESDWSATASKYTLIRKPDSLILISAGPYSIIIRATGTLPNIGSGLTSLWFENTSSTQISSWIPSATWNNTGLNPNTSYSYRVKARNGDGIETDFTSLILFSTALLPQCSDGFDNDNDNLVDYPADPGCVSAEDNNEVDEILPQCSDGIDNDNDGLIDYPADPDCDSPEDDRELEEEEIIPQCSDGIDNDNDGLIDYPADPDCDSPEDDRELKEEEIIPQCSDNIDNDNDGLVDLVDPGCENAEDNDESDEIIIIQQCADGIDNDNDGFIDLADPGCESRQDNDESDEEIEVIPEEEIPIIERIREAEIAKRITESAPVAFISEKIFDNPAVERAAKNFGIPAVALVTAFNLASILSLAGLLPYLFFIFSEPVLVLFRKKRKKFGVVYDSITKQPVDLAVLRLYNYETNKLIQTKVSDKQGRFSFIVNPGKYYIKVTKKDYIFPTQILAEQKEDLFYIDLYHGEQIEATEKTVIVPNIPIDSDKKPEPTKKVLFVYTLRKIQKVFAAIGPILTFIVFLIKPSLLLFILLVLHLILYALFKRLAVPRKPKSWGIVADRETKSGLGRAVVRLYDSRFNKLLETQVTDSQGRYSFLVGKNIYYITADKPGYQTQKTDLIEQKKPEGEAITRNIFLEKPKLKVEKELPPPKPEPKPERRRVRNLPHQWRGEETAQEIKEKVGGEEFEYKEQSKDINIPWSEQ